MYKIPIEIERYLASLCKAYSNNSEHEKAEIIANGKPRLDEATRRIENLDDNTISIGHTLYLSIPQVLFLRIYRTRDRLADKFHHDLNRLIGEPSEFINNVVLQMELTDDADWRRDSGLLITGERSITPPQEQRLWSQGMYRLFISHKSSIKDEANKLKEQLLKFGVSAFVAHEDIEPTADWQDEIVNALSSMNGFVSLLTPDYHDSGWTDHEVGFAFGRGVKTIGVKFGRDPYGLMAKFQGLRGDWNTLALDLVKLLMRDQKMLESFIGKVEDCPDFETGNTLAAALSSVDSLTNPQVERLINAYNINTQLQGSFGFNGKRTALYGEGLAEHLTRLTGDTYKVTSQGQIARIAMERVF